MTTRTLDLPSLPGAVTVQLDLGSKLSIAQLLADTEDDQHKIDFWLTRDGIKVWVRRRDDPSLHVAVELVLDLQITLQTLANLALDSLKVQDGGPPA